MPKSFAQIVLPLRVDKTYTYRITSDLLGQVQVGCRVLVPMGRRMVTGVVVELLATSPVRDVRDIVDLLEPQPVFDTIMLQLTRWIADYYLCSWEEALKMALPAELRRKRKRLIRLKEPYAQALARKLRHISTFQRDIVQALAGRGEISDSVLTRLMGREGLYAALHRLQESGYIEIREELLKPRVGVRTEALVRLNTSPEEIEASIEKLKRRAPKQAVGLMYLVSAGGTATLRELWGKAGVSFKATRGLAEKGLVDIFHQERFRESYAELPKKAPPEHILTEHQRKALEQISKATEANKFGVFLIHGVTGSGKTEVYIRAIQKVLKAGRQALVLVPEISLTPQTVSRFRSYFGPQVAVFHSGLSAGERYDAWRHLRDGRCGIAVGARSAVFAPLKKVGLIVVDEEHVDSYKQTEPAPRYHARDVAIMRAKLSNALVLLGSATPSLESFQNVQRKKYAYCSLPERVDWLPLPKVEIVDMCQEKREDNWEIFSRILKERISYRLEKGEQIILFLNRRGFSTCIKCQECGFVMSCPHCSVTLTYHAQDLTVRCHYCGYRQKAPHVCPSCGGQHIRFRGTGTQRVEREINRLYPQARVLRMDQDTTRRKGAHVRILERFRRGQADILLGTQMIAKGLDFPRVTLVGIVMADVGLNLPDFRSSERTFQMITQVAGRAGRSPLGGEVFVQTHSPAEQAIYLSRNHDYVSFARCELESRRELNYPPFGKLFLWLLQASDQIKVQSAAQKLSEMLHQQARQLRLRDVQILGPAPAPLAKIRGQHRWQVLLKSPGSVALRRVTRAVMGQSIRWPPWPGVRVRVVVDPVEML